MCKGDKRAMSALFNPIPQKKMRWGRKYIDDGANLNFDPSAKR